MENVPTEITVNVHFDIRNFQKKVRGIKRYSSTFISISEIENFQLSTFSNFSLEIFVVKYN